MSILTATRPAVKPTTLTIKGLAYSVEPIDPGEEGTTAFRLDKVRGEGIYDVVRTHDGLVKCDCPSYVMTFEGTASTCKHGRALIEAGMIEAPSPTPNRPTPPAAVAPITRADLARARMFKIKLPAAPMAAEEPQPAPVVTPTGWSEIEADDLADDDASHYGPAGDSWEGFEDLDRWTTTEDAPGVDLSGFAPAVTVVGETVEVEPPAFLRPENFTDAPEDQEWVAITPTFGLLRAIEPGNRPTQVERFAPTPEMEAERIGYELGQSGDENVRCAQGQSFAVLVSFYDGFLRGRAALDAERQEWLDLLAEEHDRMAEAFGGPEETWHAAELAEARSFAGHPA